MNPHDSTACCPFDQGLLRCGARQPDGRRSRGPDRRWDRARWSGCWSCVRWSSGGWSRARRSSGGGWSRAVRDRVHRRIIDGSRTNRRRTRRDHAGRRRARRNSTGRYGVVVVRGGRVGRSRIRGAHEACVCVARGCIPRVCVPRHGITGGRVGRGCLLPPAPLKYPKQTASLPNGLVVHLLRSRVIGLCGRAVARRSVHRITRVHRCGRPVHLTGRPHGIRSHG